MISATTATDYFYILYNKTPHSASATSWLGQATFALDIQADSGPAILLKHKEATKHLATQLPLSLLVLANIAPLQSA